jgi:putative transposase
MTRPDDATAFDRVMNVLLEEGFDGMAAALELLVNEAMKLERAAFLGADLHERTDGRKGYANGYKGKTLSTRAGKLSLQVPQVRGRVGGENFYPQALERGSRSERALKLAVAEMYVQGVSTRRVREITEKLCGLEITSSQVSRVTAELDGQLQAWRERPLGRTLYLTVDARYEKIRHGGSVVSCAVLSAIGIDHEGRRSVLGVSVQLSEAEVHWRAFLASLKDRGLYGLQLVVSDNHEGLKKALRAVFPGVSWQRCQVHLQRNATAYVPRAGLRKEVAAAIRSIFAAGSREEADRQLERVTKAYAKKAPKLSAWMKTAIPEGLTVYEIPESHRRRLKSTNLHEWMNKEIKRRTRVATLFPNEASLLRLVSAVCSEISEDWEAGRKYITVEVSC